MRNILPAGLLLCFASAAALPAAATPFNAQSISNLSINGRTYTATFFDTAYSSLVAAQQAPTFNSATDAMAALQAITGSAQYQMLAGQANQIGVASTFFRSVIVPFSGIFARTSSELPLGLPVYLGHGTAAPVPPFNPFGNYEIDATRDYTIDGLTIATFTQGTGAEVAVPEPASIAVLSLGLFGLGWVRRRV